MARAVDETTERELEADLYAGITSLCELGDQCVDEDRLADAIRAYLEAWGLLPDHKEQWSAATWILVALGETYLFDGQFERARDSLTRALSCPEGLGNPLLHLRLGQTQYELGNHERAADELARAYMGSGTEIFADEDSKYFDFLRQRMAISADGI